MDHHKITLYHGTRESALGSILKDGLLPRAGTGQNNWEHTVGSNPDSVYFTDCYPGHFAFNATRDRSERLAIIEAELDTNKLVPDEDALEQYLRGRDRIKGDMKERTMYYRALAPTLGDLWKDSLKCLGTVSHLGPVPPEAIRRVCLVSPGTRPDVVLRVSDSSVSILNHMIMASGFKAMIRWLFGEEITLAEFFGFGEGYVNLLPTDAREAALKALGSRNGIEIIDLREVAHGQDNRETTAGHLYQAEPGRIERDALWAAG